MNTKSSVNKNNKLIINDDLKYLSSFAAGLIFFRLVEWHIDYINPIHTGENYPITVLLTVGCSVVKLLINQNPDFLVGVMTSNLFSLASHTQESAYIPVGVVMGAGYLYLRKNGSDKLKEYQHNDQIQTEASTIATLGLVDDYNDLAI